MINNVYKVGIYIRLSKEDIDKEKNNESESIKNQRKLIYKYLKDNNLTVYKEYIDDGYSGTNFNRPGFINLMNDIDNGNINMVITKDLSRLGRDYIKTGYYVEEYFPIKKIRYISILDGIDTYQNTSNNDIAPFKALFNDMVSKDTSKKIKSILKNKKEQGLFLGSKAPYGYKKDTSNKNKLVIDEEESLIVKKIFELALKGKSNLKIASYLNKLNIPSPSNSKWTTSSIYNILNNKEYTGCLISNVWTSISYKNKTRIKREPHEWIIIENTHEKIIDKKIYQLVNDKKKSKSKSTLIKRKRLLLEGIIYCTDCGSKLGVSYLKKRNYYILNCNKYKKNPKDCTSHYVKYKDLEDIVINRIKEILNKRGYNDNEIVISRNLLHALINKILISSNKEIKIIYNFSKE